MGFFDDLFNNPFDFNKDGKVSISEKWLAFNIMNQCTKKNNKSFSNNARGDFDLDTSNFNWRDYCVEGPKYSVFPENYATEDAYIEALKNAKAEVERVEEIVYPNKRMQEAARRLSDIKNGTDFIYNNETIESVTEKCEFILSSSVIASKYLTVYDGFILAQAVKENFQIPVNIPDEDNKSSVYFPTLFMDIAEEDVYLAVDIWAWCIKEFGPYKKYFGCNDKLYGTIISSINDYPEEFIDVTIKRLYNDTEFCKGLLIESSEILYSSYKFVTKALELNLIEEAQEIFKAISLNPLMKGKIMEDIIGYIISDCSDWCNLEMMELVKINIMPIVKSLNDKRIQRLFPHFMNQINEYIDCVEISSEKYQFSRRFEWRNHCTDGTQYNINPLNYETENEYNEAIHNVKYAWRERKRNNRFGINVDLFETEAEYKDVEKIKQKECSSSKQAEYLTTKTVLANLSEEDKKVYKFCSVMFSCSNRAYNYLIGDLDVKIGDKILVPTEIPQQERIATVVSVFECMKCLAPYPVEKAKTILGLYDNFSKN